MKKHLLIASIFSLMVLAIGTVSSCTKFTTDPLDPLIGTYTGTLIDSDLVSHQDTTLAAFPVKIIKLTSSRIQISSTAGHLEPFYADVALTSTGFEFNVPGQTVNGTTVIGADLAAYHFPAGFTGVYVSASRQLTFATRTDPPSPGSAVIAAFTGTKQ